MPKKKTDKLSLKKVAYLILAVVLGKLLGLIAFELLSLLVVKLSENDNVSVEYSQMFGPIYSPLSAEFFWIFILVGMIGGFFLGLSWWRIVYVEHRHFRKWRKKDNLILKS